LWADKMQYDEEAAEAKLNAIRMAASLPGGLPAHALDRVLAAFLRVRAPEKADDTLGWVTVTSLYSGPAARSRKPGNVLLNWRKLIDIIPDISLAGLGATSLPVAPAVAAVLAALYIANTLCRESVEHLSDVEAVTILALWQNRDRENTISEEVGYIKTNELRAAYSLPALSQGQYQTAVNRLSKIRCIALDNGVVSLRESVRVEYV